MPDAPNRLVDSAKLPARANLEHLKNEARQRLKTIRSQRSAARLSEAQLLVARSYGFPSWRKLKSYVEALNDFGQELINAVRADDLQTIRKHLDDHPELVNASTDVYLRVRPSDALTMRLVHLAIAEAKIDVLQLLIQKGALGWAVYGRQPVSATILFEHGAIADHPPYDSHAWRPATMVASTAVLPILLQHGANPNWRDVDGDTPLHRVLKSRIVLDPTEFVKILLAAGADASLRNADGRTAFDEALVQQSKNAETYFPVRTIGPKKLEKTIKILRSGGRAH